MKNSFWDLIWSSFLDIQGILIGFLGIVITIVLSRFRVTTPIPLDLIIIIGLFTQTLFGHQVIQVDENQISFVTRINKWSLTRLSTIRIDQIRKIEVSSISTKFNFPILIVNHLTLVQKIGLGLDRDEAKWIIQKINEKYPNYPIIIENE